MRLASYGSSGFNLYSPTVVLEGEHYGNREGHVDAPAEIGVWDVVARLLVQRREARLERIRERRRAQRDDAVEVEDDEQRFVVHGEGKRGDCFREETQIHDAGAGSYALVPP